MRLDPVEQGLIGHTQRVGCCSKRQAGINESHDLKLELEDVLTRPALDLIMLYPCGY